MSKLDPKTLKSEIDQQIFALRRISRWITWLILLDSVGVLLVYYGLTSSPPNWWYAGPGIAVMVLGIAAALIAGLGYHNGKKNVEKMIGILERQSRKPDRK